MADVNFDKIVKTLEEPVYVAVGFGVLAFQRAQVCRHELQSQLGRAAGAANHVVGATKNMASAATHFAGAASDLAGAADHFAGAANHVTGAANRAGNAGSSASRPGSTAPDEAKEFLRAAVDLAGDLPRDATELLKEALALGRFAFKVLQGPVTRRANP